jgi:ATP-dependent DNA helicase PIF1
MAKFHLSTNMRLRANPEFQTLLLEVGEGKVGKKFSVPSSMIASGNTLDGLITDIFDDNAEFSNRVILTVRNDDAQVINRRVTARLAGEVHVCLSADSVNDDGADTRMYPVEFLNSLHLSGLPPHRLELKAGQFVMLLRNLNPSMGLCNGTRMRLLSVSPSVLCCEIAQGQYAGQQVFIPRITHRCNDPRLPFTLNRRQFPITGAFAITVNKSQGQSFDRVGIYLSREVFTHGQLYVALSRGRYPDRIRITNDSGSTQISTSNVVYREVID